ncbi:IgA Peptidase M64 (plasmid) [Sodalis glossinidius str. 'morsitans']|uniref:IgA Peptidase M64 n=1 Tax=Sodalis glossinidius (strain morsitans) TaxID=343509 RepID=A0A193QNS7_SODGM|nr:M64 family metallopeptidase [Sodalis glossinidius]CRL46821.1 IgA Peptidase M64 [Sodalis glossinidius str. 'morsitans']
MNSNCIWLNIEHEITYAGRKLEVIKAYTGDFRRRIVLDDVMISSNQSNGWNIYCLDSIGKILHSSYLKIKEKNIFEAFNPDSGDIDRVKSIDVSSIDAEVIIPYHENLESIKFEEVSDDVLYRKRKPYVATFKIHDLLLRNKDDFISGSRCFNHEIISRQGEVQKNKMIIAIMGDGYSFNDMEQWKKDANIVMSGFLSDPLMNEFKDCFEFMRIDVISKDSGISITGQQKKDTALETVLGCYDLDRLLCVNTKLVKKFANESLGFGGYDQVLVIGNTKEYGGAGYDGIGTLTMHKQSVELALHEFGHSAYHLADEYDYGNCVIEGDENEKANVTKETDRNKIKWRHLIKPTTQIPTLNTENGIIGLFEGAAYCKKGKYRPVFSSKMKNLGASWHAVNEEHIKKIMMHYNYRGDPTKKSKYFKIN